MEITSNKFFKINFIPHSIQHQAGLKIIRSLPYNFLAQDTIYKISKSSLKINFSKRIYNLFKKIYILISEIIIQRGKNENDEEKNYLTRALLFINSLNKNKGTQKSAKKFFKELFKYIFAHFKILLFSLKIKRRVKILYKILYMNPQKPLKEVES